MTDAYSEITPYIKRLAQLSRGEGEIDASLYDEYQVKRGLRDINGQGVVAGLTEISNIVAKREEDGKLVPCEGELYYRGYDIEDIVRGFTADGRFGFEETVFLLLFGKLPEREELRDFYSYLEGCRTLPKNFVRDVVLKAPSRNMMNGLSKSVLTLYSYDDNADDTSVENVLRQCLQLIAVFPMLSVYSYQSYKHYLDGGSLFIHNPVPEYSTSENILHMLRLDSKFTSLEAKVLDMCLVLHAEHGGGNNSTFTTRVVTSSGTDTYASVSASLGSLKGPKHGGANIKVVNMLEDMKKHINGPDDTAGIKEYLLAVLDKKAFDGAGLIYGMGHAVYSVSDPRERILKEHAKQLSLEKGLSDEYTLYKNTADVGASLIAEKRKIYKGVSPNVDFYSGFVYKMLGLPEELFTPIFAVARIAGWSAHRLEGLINETKIIRPAYKSVAKTKEYVELDKRGDR